MTGTTEESTKPDPNLSVDDDDGDDGDDKSRSGTDEDGSDGSGCFRSGVMIDTAPLEAVLDDIDAHLRLNARTNRSYSDDRRVDSKNSHGGGSSSAGQMGRADQTSAQSRGTATSL